MVDPARHPAVSRRRFLALAAGAVSVPWVAGCSPAHTPTAAGPRATDGTARYLSAVGTDGIRAQVRTSLPHVSLWARRMGLGGQGLPAGNPDHLLVLSYHNITADGRQQQTGRPDHYTVSAADFAAQMQMLQLAGFRTVRMRDVLASHAHGVPLPPRSMLVTFDDGGAGQWIYADPVLADVGFTAVTFLITGHLGSSHSYLTWEEAQALRKTGRWDIEAHTHDLHHLVPTGPLRPPASVLINRVWDPVRRTLEPIGAARARVQADLTTSLALLSRHGFARPSAFAYPFSQVEGPSNDPTMPAYVAGLLAATFPIRMTNASPGRSAQPDDLRSGMLPRLEVHSGMSSLNLFERVRTADHPAGLDHSTGEWSGG